MLRNSTGCQFHPLSTGATDVPTLTAGQPVTFNLATMPVVLGRMCYYLPKIILTITGNLVQAGGSGSRFPWVQLYRSLIDTLELRNAWHGSPISPQFWKGTLLPHILYVGNGYNYGAGQHAAIAAAVGTYPFQLTMALPLSLGVGLKPQHTALPAALYKDSQLTIQVAAAAVLTGLSTGATFTSLAARASAMLLPEPEVRIGPAVEWVDYQTPASAGQTEVRLASLGNSTQLLRTEKGAGLCWLGAITSTNGQPGAITLGANLLRVSIPFRNQGETAHTAPFFTQQLLSMGQRRSFTGQGDTTTAATLSETADWPYFNSADGAAADEETNATVLPLVPLATDFEYSKAQIVSDDASYFLALTAGPAGTHHTLAQHLRSWSPDAWDDAARVLVNKGVTKAVLGTSAGLKWKPKLLRKQNVGNIAAKKTRFLPMCLVPGA